MKLRNKKTGMVVDGYVRENSNYEIAVFKPKGMPKDQVSEWYSSLTELNEEWEDCEEPKDFWYIDDFMIMCGAEGEFTTPDLGSFTKKDIGKLKEIGNYFETKEEAEKAVEKLKALRRLKDSFIKRITISGHHALDRGHIVLAITTKSYYSRSNVSRGYLFKEYNEFADDLDLLFGEEEE